MKSNRFPLIVAHRGSSAIYPENTLVSYNNAFGIGVDGLELDVQMSKDGVPIVYHDRTLAKVGCPKLKISQLNLNQIKQIDAGKWFASQFEGQKILTLSEVLQEYGANTKLFIELKCREKNYRLDYYHKFIDNVFQVLIGAQNVNLHQNIFIRFKGLICFILTGHRYLVGCRNYLYFVTLSKQTIFLNFSLL